MTTLITNLDEQFVSGIRALIDVVEEMREKYPGVRFEISARSSREMIIMFWPIGSDIPGAVGMNISDINQAISPSVMIEMRSNTVCRAIDDFLQDYEKAA